ncbi:hypothetical protein J0H33_05985 [bacterium]|nr:hypothetical protein [bacterium]
MLPRRQCQGTNESGTPCRQAPLHDEAYCFWHSPGHAEEAAEARRLGGHRRKRERVVSGAYDFEGLGSIPEILRLVEVAAFDTLGLENSVARNRTLVAVAQAAANLHEKGELEERIRALEAVMSTRPDPKAVKR